MRKTKFIVKIALCIVLIAAILSQTILPIFSQTYSVSYNSLSLESETAVPVVTPGFTEIPQNGLTSKDSPTVYLKEIQISTGSTAAEAKKWLTDNGYIVLNEDLNAGTGKDYSYIGYKTTTNRNEAICDISMLSMESGYKMINYKEMIRQSQKGIEDRAEGMLGALAEFRANLAAGSLNAMIAKETLDLFRAGENDSVPLGDYLLDPSRTVNEIVDILMMSNSLVFSMIYNQVVFGVSDYNQDGEEGAIKTWADRLVAHGQLPKDLTVDKLDELDELYYEKAEKIAYAAEQYMQQVYDALERIDTDDDGMLSENDVIVPPVQNEDEALALIESLDNGSQLNTSDMDMLVLAVYDVLYEYSYGKNDRNEDETLNWAFEEYYLNGNIRTLYPVVAVLTDGQLEMMQISGVVNMVLALQNTQEVYDEAKAKLDDFGPKLIEENGGVNPSVFIGVNRELYKQEVGLTTEAARVAASSANYNKLTEENLLRKDLKTALQVCGSAALVAAGVVTITTTVVGAIVGSSGFFATLVCIATSTMATAGSFCVSFGTFAPLALAVLAIVAIVVILAIWLADIIRENWNDKHPEYTEIPSSMYEYDVKNNAFIRYEPVLERGGDPGDLNCFQGRRWNALYVSYDQNAGSPITANDMGEFFRVKRGDPNVDDTYRTVSNFGENNPVNLNSHTYKDKVKGLYLFYTTENSLAGITEEIKSGRYLYSIIVATHEKAEAAKLEIKNKTGYELLDFNLTPGKRKATYIGYRTIDNPNHAITDIRIAWNTTGDIKFGNGIASYACAGTYAAHDEAIGLSIYYTKDQMNGNPILADFFVSTDINDIPEGYEPVNLFNGGPAFNLNYSHDQPVNNIAYQYGSTYLYFRYDTPCEGKPIYLGGLMFLETGTTSQLVKDSRPPNFEEYAAELGWNLMDIDFKGVSSSQVGKEGLRLVYSVTNNPKRAIYDIRTYLAEPKATQVMQNINFDGVGFVVAERLVTLTQKMAGNSVLFLRHFDPSHSFLENAYSSWFDMRDPLVQISGTKNGKLPTKLYAGLEKGYVTENLAPRRIGLYVSGPTVKYDDKGKEIKQTPILMSEFYVGKAANAPSNLKAVVDFTDCYGQNPTDLSATLGIYMYYNQTFPEKLKYIASIQVVYSDTENFSQDEAKLQLLASGGHEILEFNLASVNGSIMYEKYGGVWLETLYDGGYYDHYDGYDNRAAFIRVTRTKTKAKAIEDIRIVEVGKNDPEPPDSPKINGYTYQKVSNRIHCKRLIDARHSNNKIAIQTEDHYFYIYTGGNGVALTDISFSKSAMNPGTYSVINQNNYANPQNPWWIQMHSPEIADSKYIASVGVVTAKKYDDRGSAQIANPTKYGKKGARETACGVAADPYNRIYCELLNKGYTQCVGMDFNHGTSDGETVAIGYTLTKNPKNAVTNIITSEKNQATIKVKGITYTRGTTVSLNETLNYGNKIYLYYTLDANAGNMITGIGGSLSTSSGVEYLQRAEGGISNLNLNAADKDPSCKNNSYLPAQYLYIRRDGNMNKNAALSASVFAENPELKMIVAVAGMAVLVSVITVIVKKSKSKKNKWEKKL